MSRSTAPLLRVRDWNQRHENNRSREMKRTDWFPALNDLSADSYVELVGHPEGAAHLGAWHAVLMAASRAKPRRGLLLREDGRPHTPESLARVTRLPEAIVEAAVARLLGIGLLEVVDDDPPQTSNLPPHPGAGNPQAPASKPQDTVLEGKGSTAEAEERDYQCPLCSSRVRGEGARLVDGKVVPCSCASAEYVARLRERGTFARETVQ
jgi:hypothetical protein